MVVQITRRRFTADEYHRMAEVGLLTEDDRIELIEGEIVEMTPIGSRHAGAVNRLNALFHERLGSRAVVAPQNPLRLDEHSEPEPDLALLRPRSDFYSSTHPIPEDVLLVVEIADSSLDYDRQIKVPLYARCKIPEVWIVNLEGEGVEVFRKCETSGYAVRQTLGRGDSLAPQALPDAVLDVSEVLGQR